MIVVPLFRYNIVFSYKELLKLKTEQQVEFLIDPEGPERDVLLITTSFDGLIVQSEKCGQAVYSITQQFVQDLYRAINKAKQPFELKVLDLVVLVTDEDLLELRRSGSVLLEYDGQDKDSILIEVLKGGIGVTSYKHGTRLYNSMEEVTLNLLAAAAKA